MSPSDPDWLDELLAEPGPYIADEGFTEAVLGRLPERPPRRAWLWVQALMLVAASGLFWAVDGAPALYALLAPLATPLTGGLVPVGLAVVVALALAWFPLAFAVEE